MLLSCYSNQSTVVTNKTIYTKSWQTINIEGLRMNVLISQMSQNSVTHIEIPMLACSVCASLVHSGSTNIRAITRVNMNRQWTPLVQESISNPFNQSNHLSVWPSIAIKPKLTDDSWRSEDFKYKMTNTLPGDPSAKIRRPSLPGSHSPVCGL